MGKRCAVVILLAVLMAGAFAAWNGVLESLRPVEPAEVDGNDLPADDLYNAADLSDVEEVPFVPSQDEVLAARELALEGMTSEQIERLTELITGANMWWEYGYLYENIFSKLEDPDGLTWNYFDQTGEIHIGWAINADLDPEAVCAEENITKDEFYAKYGARAVTNNPYNADDFISWLEDIIAGVQNEYLRADLQYIADETQLAKEGHVMEHANNAYKMLHDMDYFLLRYGPVDVGQFVRDKSTVSKYYGMLSIYS